MRLINYYGALAEGYNLWEDFTSTEKGDEVIRKGIVVPLLGINDGIYEVCVRMADESSIWDVLPLKENLGFPLEVSDRLVIADLAVFLHWSEGEGWLYLDLSPGFYSVDIAGYRKLINGVVASCGYDFILHHTNACPSLSAELDKDMQVLTLD
ncbi:hypothetical protein DXO246_13480 [Xanthomonas oryzae pv. oryzae]|nr:hypothetical protein DXO015_19755 [Xanthomonas oryzae pv. oryzae]OLH63667.1 hypothetical protein DXO200_19035 [Xanthomonas oryzae pv. oryzae]OLH99240.1 hypothetical protein DXO246_13480 [Xanthomonas oryzae pv. oryzae]OLI13185.1 hypothetical protein DXO242_16285 [Xanthomonas oryzae pv. oryzae]OLI49197.1 hypothetical protein IXO89_18260 [Xanthomonas oryzae pv. oryzae]